MFGGTSPNATSQETLLIASKENSVISQMSLVDFMAALPLATVGDTLASQCSGPILNQSEWEGGTAGTNYCADNLAKQLYIKG